MEREDEIRTVPSWKAHLLTATEGDVEPVRDQDWRLTFKIDQAEIEMSTRLRGLPLERS